MKYKVIKAEVTKQTERFVFFTVTGQVTKFGFIKSVVEENCFISKNIVKGLCNTVYLDGENQRWWRGPAVWHSLQSWAHKNDNEVLKKYLNA